MGMIALLSKTDAVTIQALQSIAVIFQFDNDAGLEENVRLCESCCNIDLERDAFPETGRRSG
jgi:hypothetical protein